MGNYIYILLTTIHTLKRKKLSCPQFLNLKWVRIRTWNTFLWICMPVQYNNICSLLYIIIIGRIRVVTIVHSSNLVFQFRHESTHESNLLLSDLLVLAVACMHFSISSLMPGFSGTKFLYRRSCLAEGKGKRPVSSSFSFNTSWCLSH